MPIRSARELYAKASGARYLKVAGVSVHIGSQITEVAPFAEAVDRVAAIVRQLRADGHTIDFVDRDVPPRRMKLCAHARSVVETAAGRADAFLALIDEPTQPTPIQMETKR